MITTGKAVLAEAARVVSTDRNETYGHPSDSFARIGRAWDAILDAAKYTPGGGIDARIVGLLMIALKADREAFAHKHDNLVDIAGYAACIAETTRQEAPK